MDVHTLHNCAHCNNTGVCKSGENGSSCYVCAKKNELRLWLFKPKTYYGLACGTCGGLGKTDTLTHRMNNRTQPLIAWLMVCLCFLLVAIFGITDSKNFTAVLTLCSTILGGIIAYYFNNQNNRT